MGSGLPVGVLLRPFVEHRDERGTLTEIFRDQWESGVVPVQWNAVLTEASVLRGVHVHLRHSDYLVVLDGQASIGLRDLRPGSPTEGQVALVVLRGDEPAGLTIPPGVGHGFFFHEHSLHVYAVTEYWDPADELACHWADPALAIPWPTTNPRLSDRDAAAPPLAAIAHRVPAFR